MERGDGYGEWIRMKSGCRWRVNGDGSWMEMGKGVEVNGDRE